MSLSEREREREISSKKEGELPQKSGLEKLMTIKAHSFGGQFYALICFLYYL